MSQGAEVTVKSQLMKLVEDLEKIQKASLAVSDQIKATGENVGKALKDQTGGLEDGLNRTKTLGQRVADQLKKDFQALFSVTSLTSGLKLSEQFAGSVKESVNLSDAVRRLGGVFGLAQSQFASFQNKLIQGFGQIGLGSDAAANALEGLAQTPVRGEANLTSFAKTAAQLASISGQRGQEGTIAKGISGIIQAQGGNPNDQAQVRGTADEILKIRQATGKSVTEVTQTLGELYKTSNQTFQKMLRGGGSTTLATAAMISPGTTSFIEDYLGKGKFENAGAQARGFGNIIGANGQINAAQVAAIMKSATSIGGGDAQQGLVSAFGLTKEQAQGFIRLSEAMKDSGSAINGAHAQVVDLNKAYKETMSFGDAFKSNINQVKRGIAPLVSGAAQYGTSALVATGQSPLASVGVAAGGVALSALLLGGGLRGVGGLIGGELKSKAIEGVTGEKVQRVEVTNFPAGLGAGGGLLSKAGGFLGKAGLIGAAGSVGYAIGTGLNAIDEQTGGHIGKAIQASINTLAQVNGFGLGIINNEDAFRIAKEQIHRVKIDSPHFSPTKPPARGHS